MCSTILGKVQHITTNKQEDLILLSLYISIIPNITEPKVMVMQYGKNSPVYCRIEQKANASDLLWFSTDLLEFVCSFFWPVPKDEGLGLVCLTGNLSSLSEMWTKPSTESTLGLVFAKRLLDRPTTIERVHQLAYGSVRSVHLWLYCGRQSSWAVTWIPSMCVAHANETTKFSQCSPPPLISVVNIRRQVARLCHRTHMISMP